MLEKEAEDFLKKSLKVDDDEFDFFKNEASCKEEIKRLTDFIEPREKRIAELEKENAELKEKLNIRSCQNCEHNNKSCPNDGSCHNFSLWRPFKNSELTKAKELLTRFVMASVYFNGKEADLVEESEQFLKDSIE